MENELLNYLESDIITEKDFASDLFLFDRDLANYEIKTYSFEPIIDEGFDYFSLDEVDDWSSQTDISGVSSSNTAIVGTQFDEEEIDFDMVVETLIEIFSLDVENGFVEALEKALMENSDELIFRDGYGNELTDEEINEILGIDFENFKPQK